MITILLTTIATATLLIDSAERLLADLTHLVCAAKSLLASLRRSKQNTQVQETSAKKSESHGWKRIRTKRPSSDCDSQ